MKKYWTALGVDLDESVTCQISTKQEVRRHRQVPKQRGVLSSSYLKNQPYRHHGIIVEGLSMARETRLSPVQEPRKHRRKTICGINLLMYVDDVSLPPPFFQKD
jgi:hypothetical protein